MYCWEVAEMMWRRKIFYCSDHRCQKTVEQMLSSTCVACTPLLHVQPMSSSGSFCIKETQVLLLLDIACFYFYFFKLMSTQATSAPPQQSQNSHPDSRLREARFSFQTTRSSSNPRRTRYLLSSTLLLFIQLGLHRQPELSVEYKNIRLALYNLQKAVSLL